MREIRFEVWEVWSTLEGKKDEIRIPCVNQEFACRMKTMSRSPFGSPGDWVIPFNSSGEKLNFKIEIDDVRVERVRDITGDGAYFEGIMPGSGPLARTARMNFKMAWEAKHGKDFPWKKDPFVWVVSYRLVQ